MPVLASRPEQMSPADDVVRSARTAPTTVARRAGPADWLRQSKSSVAPFLVGDDRELLLLADGGVAGFVRRGRWAVFATDPATPMGTEDAALDEVLERTTRAGLRAVFVAVADPAPYERRGLACRHAADDPIIDLASFSLTGGRRSSIRHSVASARRAGLRVERYSVRHAKGCRVVSEAWLATKRGGEMGFTLGRFDPHAGPGDECRVVVDRSRDVLGFVTWPVFDGGRARVLDMMRRSPSAPNPTMDLAIADSLASFAADGVERVSLGSVPISHGRLAERVYPTVSLHRFKDKFAPSWERRYLAGPRRATEVSIMLAIARAYCADGVLAALRRNG